MSPAERRSWARLQRQAAQMSPALIEALTRAYAVLRARLNDREISLLLQRGDVLGVIELAAGMATQDAAFLPVRERFRQQVQRGGVLYNRDIPRPSGAATITVAFDFLNPRVLDAVRTLETKAIGTLATEVRDTVRAYIENGIRDGVSPLETARGLRSVIGLAPNQLGYVENFRKALESGDFSKALGYQMRDKRFDRTLQKLAKGGALTLEQIEKMTAAYRTKYIAWNAQTHARTATLDALRLGQQLSWETAIERGDVDPNRLVKRWVATLDDRVREEHEQANGIEVPFRDLFPVDGGVQRPGENTYNCRCSMIVRLLPKGVLLFRQRGT